MDTIDTKKIIVISILLIFISFGLGLYVGKTYIADKSKEPEIAPQIIENQPQKIKVYVTGEVKHPDFMNWMRTPL